MKLSVRAKKLDTMCSSLRYVCMCVCVFCTDYIDGRTNETERKRYSSHRVMKDVGERK